jgi:hypothetical protein
MAMTMMHRRHSPRERISRGLVGAVRGLS